MVPEDIKDILKNADQEATIQIELGPTMPEIFFNDKRFIDILEKGAKASLNLTLVSNIRKAVMEILHNHEEMD